MKVRTISALCLAVMLNLSLTSLASAYCDNRNWPKANWTVNQNADGSKTVSIFEWDLDYLGKRGLFLYENGRLIQSTTGDWITRVMPKGTGTWNFYAADFDTCGTQRMTVPVMSISN